MESYRGLTASGRDKLGKRVGIKGAPEARKWPPTTEPYLPEAECTFPLSLAKSGSLTLATKEWEGRVCPLKFSQLAVSSRF